MLTRKPVRGRAAVPTESPEHRHLGDAVRELREREGIARDELAARAGLAVDELAAIERGDVDPTFVTLVRLARGVPAPLAELMRIFERRRATTG
jgi:transcriptional regulator with XRE-family HTH domain